MYNHIILTMVQLTASFTILTCFDGEVLALKTKGWPVETTVTWIQVKIHVGGILSWPPHKGLNLHTNYYWWNYSNQNI